MRERALLNVFFRHSCSLSQVLYEGWRKGCAAGHISLYLQHVSYPLLRGANVQVFQWTGSQPAQDRAQRERVQKTREPAWVGQEMRKVSRREGIVTQGKVDIACPCTPSPVREQRRKRDDGVQVAPVRDSQVGTLLPSIILQSMKFDAIE